MYKECRQVTRQVVVSESHLMSSPSTAHGGSTRQSRGKEFFKEFASLYYGGLLEDLFQFNRGCKSQWEYCGIL